MALCSHIKPGPVPWDVLLVLDDHLGPTDALAVCRTCRTPYLLEMVDWRPPLRLFRVSEPRSDAVQGLLRNLERGSCDLRRAGEEVRHFSQGARRLPWLVLLDTSAYRLEAVIEHSGPLPGASWREAPCDGALIDEVGTQAARL
jgi:hypothetical protein